MTTSKLRFGDIEITLVLGAEAARNVAETGTDPARDIVRIADGLHPALLEAECLDGADGDRVEGWREYVYDVAEAAKDLCEARLEARVAAAVWRFEAAPGAGARAAGKGDPHAVRCTLEDAAGVIAWCVWGWGDMSHYDIVVPGVDENELFPSEETALQEVWGDERLFALAEEGDKYATFWGTLKEALDKAEANVSRWNYADADEGTLFVEIQAWKDGDPHLFRFRESRTIVLEPEEPKCSHEDGHDWVEIGLQGHGGGVIIRERCEHCGLVRVTDTWAQNPSNGEQGFTSVEYDREEALED